MNKFKLLILTSFLFSPLLTEAQSFTGKKISAVLEEYDLYYSYREGELSRMVFRKKEDENILLYAYADAGGVIKIQLPKNLQFINDEYFIGGDSSSVSDFREGLAAVRDSNTGLAGYINAKGEVVVKPEYTIAGRFSEGLAYYAILESCNGGESRPNKVGYINKENKKIITLPDQLAQLYGCCYFSGGEFKNGVALMEVREYGFDCNCYVTIVIDKNGKVLNHNGTLMDVAYRPVKID